MSVTKDLAFAERGKRLSIGAGTIDRKAIIAACIGSALEWYDAFAYLYFSLVIAKLFFPAEDPTVSLLLAVGTFGLSYLAKPLGALFFASYADRVSRKRAMTYTLSLMSLGVAIITFCPPYGTIGSAASALMLAARFIQGFSSGGEYGAATSFLVELSPLDRRGFFSSFNISAIGLTSVLGGVMGWIINANFTEAEIASYAWRIPFALGLLIIPATVYLRQRIPEPRGGPREVTPVREIFKNHKALSLLAIGAFAPITITNYALAFFLPTFVIKFLHLSPNDAFIGTAVYGLLQFFLSPVFGYVSDRYDRRGVLTVAILVLAVISIPCFLYLIAYPSLGALVVTEILLGLAATGYQAPMPAYICDLFPPEVRTTSIAVVHDLTATIFGGLTPFFITSLSALAGSNLVPGFYVAASALVAFACICALRPHQVLGLPRK